MKVFFDHCVPRTLRARLPGHEVATARERRWDQLRNGDLIAAVEKDYEVMITSDQNLRYQQNLASRKLALVILPTNNLRKVLALSPTILAVLATIQPGDYVEIPRA